MRRGYKMTLQENMIQWREAAQQCRFFNKPVSEMDREELLSMIGFLIEDQTRSREQSHGDREFILDLMNICTVGASGARLK
jgi:hypothetical protein